MDESGIITIVFSVFFTILLLCISFIILLLIYRRRRVENELEKQQLRYEHAKQLIQMQYEIQTQTMQEIGREIHDSVGQKLTLASLYTHQLDFKNEYPLIQGNIANISTIINESLQELRALSRSLTNFDIEEKNLKELLENEMDRICAASGLSANIQISDNNELSTFSKTILLRIVQEFFQNSIKYSEANRILLKLEYSDSGLQLLLQDNGKGFEYHESKKYVGIGIENIKKRSAFIGGRLTFMSGKNKGTTLVLLVPKEKLQAS